MTTSRRTRAASALLAAALEIFASPAPGEDRPVREYLDEQTAATVTVATESLVFARERTDLAVNARDYVSLVPIEVNRSGTRTYYWFGYLWSTIDRRNGEVLMDDSDQLVLLADGRPIRLQSATQSMRELGIGELPESRPGRAAMPLLLPADPGIVSFVGQAADLSVLLIRGGEDQSFSLWRDARRPVRDFAAHLGLDAH